MQQEMKYIYTVYQKGSFSKAAQALYMTQPALSIAVQRVENEIGMPIFRRDHQPRRNGLPQVIIEKFLLGFPGDPNALIADFCALSDSFLGHVECSLRHIRPVGCGVFKVGGGRLFPVGMQGVSFAHGLRRKLYHTMVMQCNLISFAYRS